MCVVLIVRQQEGPWRWKHARYLDGPDQSQSGWCENTHRTQRHTHQRSSRLHASMIMLRNGEKKESTMCVVLIDLQEEGPWRQKHAQYLDGLEQLQSRLCENTHLTQLCTHQRFLRLHASMIMLRNGEKEESTMCVVLIDLQEEGPWRKKHEQYLDGPEESQIRFCKHTNHTQCSTHQRSPSLHASMMMLSDGEK